MDPELRARRIVNISQHASVDFCKSFWLLAETGLSHLAEFGIISAYSVTSMFEHILNLNWACARTIME